MPIALRIEGADPASAAAELSRILETLAGQAPLIVGDAGSLPSPDERKVDLGTAVALTTVVLMLPSTLNDVLSLKDRLEKTAEAEALRACTVELQRQGRCARVMVERPGEPPRPLDSMTPAEILDAVCRR